MNGIRYRAGHVFPFGASVIENGIHFSAFSRDATGYPELSFHGTEPWNLDMNGPGLCFASLWAEDHARYGTQEDCYLYVAVNAHWEEHRFALPIVPQGYQWHLAFRSDGFLSEPGGEEPLWDGGLSLGERTTAVLIAKKTD